MTGPAPEANRSAATGSVVMSVRGVRKPASSAARSCQTL